MHKVGNKIECNNMHGERIKVAIIVDGLLVSTEEVKCMFMSCEQHTGQSHD